MSSPTTAAAVGLNVPRSSSPKTAVAARAGVAMSIATFAMAGASAIQAVLYLSRFGTNSRTDAFFVAFALYTTFGVFSQSLRLTSVPLLVAPARMSVRQFAAVLVLIGVPVIVATGPLAGPLAHLLAPSLSSADRAVTQSALPVLGVATTLQLWAAGGATVLAIRDRFGAVAGAYIAGAAAGLATYVALMGTAGELTLGWSMLAMAAVTCAWMLAGVWASGRLEDGQGARVQPRALLTDAGVLLGRTIAYLAFNVLFVITLSFASRAAVGDVTVLSYAYLFASYLVAGTGMALGMGRIPEMTRGAREENARVIADTVPQGFRYAVLLVAPAMAALITAGAPLIHELFPASLNADGVHNLRTFTALLVPWVLAALLVNFLLPAMFAMGRTRLVNALAVPLVASHIAVTALLTWLLGTDGAVAAFFIAPLGLGITLLATGARGIAASLAAEMARDALRFVALAAVAFGTGELVAVSVASGLAASLLAGVLGSGLYLAGIALFARRQLVVLVRTLRPAPAPA